MFCLELFMPRATELVRFFCLSFGSDLKIYFLRETTKIGFLIATGNSEIDFQVASMREFRS